LLPGCAGVPSGFEQPPKGVVRARVSIPYTQIATHQGCVNNWVFVDSAAAGIQMKTTVASGVCDVWGGINPRVDYMFAPQPPQT